METAIRYLQGFGSYLMSEALPNALPEGQNSPQKVPYGLYAEQLSGSSFTSPRHTNLRSWLYRIRPSVLHGEFQRFPHAYLLSSPFAPAETGPNQLRWNPLPIPQTSTDFIEGLVTIAGHGSLQHFQGAAIHLYACTRSMQDRYFYNADGEWLIVPQIGELILMTEFGTLKVSPAEIAVIPRGVKIQVHLVNEQARGYICENYGVPFQLPELGPIGANGLANPRDFCYPNAQYEDKKGKFELIAKFQGSLWTAPITHSPLDVVAWHGNYAPYKYDLRLFNTINTVSFDHPDPSIFTVLTSPTDTSGVANVDFVIFPERWMVAEHTFRPPYYHRNIMSEYMGLIYGTYDAKEEGFVPGGGSLHNCMSPHGPDRQAFEKGTETVLKPQFYAGTLAFMFESRFVWTPTTFALQTSFRQANYSACWQTITSKFQEPEKQKN